MRLFVSHSEKDKGFVEAFVELLHFSLKLKGAEIRCTSVDGYRLPGGAKIGEQLRQETLSAEAFIGIISSNSLDSMFVLFELGARWGGGKTLIPILAPGVPATIMEAPLSGLNALRGDDRAQLHQVVEDLATQLRITPETPALCTKYIDRVLASGEGIAAACEPPTSTKHQDVKSPDVAAPLLAANSFSEILDQLAGFTNETNKLGHLEESKKYWPSVITFEEVTRLIDMFLAETRKLAALESVRSRLYLITEAQKAELATSFLAETNRRQAFRILRS